MVFAIDPNLTRKDGLEVTLEVCAQLDRMGVKYFMDLSCKESLASTNASFMHKEYMLDACNILISVGGDGTIIRSAKDALRFSKPVLGINAGRLAFMAGLERNEIPLLENVLKSEYCTEKRMLLKATLQEGDKIIESDFCLNDVVITRPGRAQLLEIRVERQGKHLIKYFADGLIVSTPTGSTAYSLSAGGPIIDPALESMMLTPICAHSLFARPFVLSADSEITVKTPTDQEVVYFCDGSTQLEISPGSNLLVSKANVSAEFIRIKSDTFVDVLNSKLTQWNGNF